MQVTEIGALLEERFKDKIEKVHADDIHGYAMVDQSVYVEVCTFLRDDERTQLHMLHDLTAVDMVSHFEVVLHMNSLTLKHTFCVKVKTKSRDDSTVPSVVAIWPTADWHERETWDLMGVRFDGHPDLRRILLPEDWQGHPLRKDEGNPLEYHGIPGISAIRGAEESLRKQAAEDAKAKRAASSETRGAGA